MAACTPLQFTEVTQQVLANLNEKAQKFGYQITDYKGSATITTPITLSFDYDYNPETQALTIAITDKPFFVGCGIIADVLTKQIDSCR
jgi:hypothetical protein